MRLTQLLPFQTALFAPVRRRNDADHSDQQAKPDDREKPPASQPTEKSDEDRPHSDGIDIRV